jgi:hypothetical protein
MKSCPVCSRTYGDDTLVFCLDDGSRLSLTGVAPSLDPERTEILSEGLNPAQAPPRATIPSPPPAYTQGASHRPRRSGTVWIILGGAFMLVIIGLVIVAGFIVWNASDKTAQEPLRVTPTPTINDVSPQPSPTTQPSIDVSPDWLDGVWEGEGYQTDTKTTWAVRLTVHDDSYSIEYPDIPCQGRWDLIDKNSRAATFTEVITQGADRCANNSHVMVEKTSASEISCRFTHAGSRAVIATVVLSKKSQ